MPRAGNSAGKSYDRPGAGAGRGMSEEEFQQAVREGRESPDKFKDAVKFYDWQSRRDLINADDLAQRIAKHAHFAGPINTPYSKESQLDEYGRSQATRINYRNMDLERANDFYGKFDNPKYAGTLGVDNEENNSRRAMGMDAKARARQAARSRNNPTNPNDR